MAKASGDEGRWRRGVLSYTIVPSATTSPDRLVLESTLTLDTGSFLSIDPPPNFDLINEAIVTVIASRVSPLTIATDVSSVKGRVYNAKIGENSMPLKPSYNQQMTRNRKR